MSVLSRLACVLILSSSTSSFAEAPSLVELIRKIFVQDDNFVSLINDPADALWVRLHLIREAKRTIDIQTYEFSLDNSGSLFTQALVDATNRGVQVRLIIDQAGSRVDRDAMAALVTFAPQVEVKVFRPIARALKPPSISIAVAGITHLVRINKRMHNKLMTIDGVMAIVGGRNITDYYYGSSPKFTYQDREALLIGPLVKEMDTTFRAYWENPLSVPASELRDVARVLRKKSYSVDDLFRNKPTLSRVQPLLDTPATIEATMRRVLSSAYLPKAVDYIADVPGKRDGWRSVTSTAIQDLLLSAKSEIVIQTPYMVFDKRIGDLFKRIERANPGIRIRVSTGSLVSSDSALLTYAAKLQQRPTTTTTLALNVFEFKLHPGEYPEWYVNSIGHDADEEPYFTIHAKAIVIDSQAVFIGSFNIDPRSFGLDTECGIIARDKTFASQVRAEILFDMAAANSNRIAPRGHSQTIVAKAVTPTELEETLLEVLDQLALWTTRLYEGKPIAGAVGFVPQTSEEVVSFREICREDFGSVLSNGFDTLLRCSFSGAFMGMEALYPPAKAPSFAPYRQASIAHWSKDGRIAVALNGLGEILLFRNGELLFTRRSGKWRFLTHKSFLTQMGCPQDKAVRRAIYESCMDASFARTGACLGVVSSSHISEWKLCAPSIYDHLDAQTSTKSKAIALMLDGKAFQDLDRRIRQELLAIDGATLLDHHGRVLAVGAILKIEGGSRGGGRLAAARESAKLGLGIKVSQDGGILGFRDAESEPEFSVMA